MASLALGMRRERSPPLVQDPAAEGHGSRSQSNRLRKVAPLPCERSPIRKILAADHTPAPEAASPPASARIVCHAGGGDAVANRTRSATGMDGGNSVSAIERDDDGSR